MSVPTKNLSHCQASLSEPQIASPPRVDRSLASLHGIIHLLAPLIHLALPPSEAHPCSSRLPLRLGGTPADKECFDTPGQDWKVEGLCCLLTVPKPSFCLQKPSPFPLRPYSYLMLFWTRVNLCRRQTQTRLCVFSSFSKCKDSECRLH